MPIDIPKISKKSSLFLLIICFFVAASNSVAGGVFRGFNVSTNLDESDFLFFRESCVTALRVSFVEPLLLTSDGEISLAGKSVLDTYIELAKKYGLKLVVDVHTLPGAKKKYSGDVDDSIWDDLNLRMNLLSGYGKLAKLYSGENAVLAFDLMNEPMPRDMSDYREVLQNIIRIVKSSDSNRRLYIQPPISRNIFGVNSSQYRYWGVIKDLFSENVHGTLHYYDPGQYTHQGLRGFEKYVSLPAEYSTEEKISDMLVKHMGDIAEGRNFLVGEFSVSNYAGSDSILYLNSLIAFFEKKKWSWFYHAYKESDVWNPSFEYEGGKLKRKNDSPRMALLKGWFKKGC